MEPNKIRTGMLVKTTLNPAHAVISTIPPEYRAKRKNAIGVVAGHVPGHTDKWWFVTQRGVIAAYHATEINPVRLSDM